MIGFASPTTALNSCDGRACYDDRLPILPGDTFTWTYIKKSTSGLSYYHSIDKGLPRDFAMNTVDPASITIEIIKEIRGISTNDYFLSEDEYFETTITIAGSSAPSDIEEDLFETFLINPTLYDFDGGVIN
ncbi:MAG: hypothetical protein HeimC2_15650 [Candidatus Heimdallarchaeota archaeon LC_2]|nr:MAG: hypothetical protein HeimC2_15650 [Candidatus Heimdallarchaeota archaeon LC_2]